MIKINNKYNNCSLSICYSPSYFQALLYLIRFTIVLESLLFPHHKTMRQRGVDLYIRSHNQKVSGFEPKALCLQNLCCLLTKMVGTLGPGHFYSSLRLWKSLGPPCRYLCCLSHCGASAPLAAQPQQQQQVLVLVWLILRSLFVKSMFETMGFRDLLHVGGRVLLIFSYLE